MVWLIVIAAMGVLGVAAIVATGQLGEMPEPVNDRPKPHIPEKPFGAEFMAELRLPRGFVGYDRTQVDEFLEAALNQQPAASPTFDVVSSGYDMQAVDQVLSIVADQLTAVGRLSGRHDLDEDDTVPSERNIAAPNSQAWQGSQPAAGRDMSSDAE